MGGASAVNIFNYTFMQEYFSQMLGLEVGEYFHIANNLHYYDYHKSLIEELASLQNVKDDSFCYEKNFHSLEDFDRQIKKLIEWEDNLRTNNKKEIIGFEDDFFNDWAKVLFFKTGLQQIEFTNPIRLCKLNCVMLYSHSISSVGERPAPRGGTTRPDERKITII